MAGREAEVGFERLSGWLDRYQVSHPDTLWTVEPTGDPSPGAVVGADPDGGRARIEVPYVGLDFKGEGDPRVALVEHLARRWRLGLLVVRRGGFAVAHLVGPDLVGHKIGRRHVQGKTKAGGWSQQRFARRRENQARAAFDAAADHAARLLGGQPLDVLACGGDRNALAQVLGDPRLPAVAKLPRHWLGGMGDPDRRGLDRAIVSARSVSVEITDPPDRGPLSE